MANTGSKLRGLEYPPPSIAGGMTRPGPTPVPRLTPEQIEKLRAVAKEARARNPLPPSVAVQVVFGLRRQHGRVA